MAIDKGSSAPDRTERFVCGEVVPAADREPPRLLILMEGGVNGLSEEEKIRFACEELREALQKEREEALYKEYCEARSREAGKPGFDG